MHNNAVAAVATITVLILKTNKFASNWIQIRGTAMSGGWFIIHFTSIVFRSCSAYLTCGVHTNGHKAEILTLDLPLLQILLLLLLLLLIPPPLVILLFCVAQHNSYLVFCSSNTELLPKRMSVCVTESVSEWVSVPACVCT